MCTVYPLRSRYAYWLLFYLRKVPNMSKLMCPKPEKKTYLEKCLICVLHGSISIEKELLLWGIPRAPPDSTMLEALGTPASNMWKGSSCQHELGCMKPFTVHSLVCYPWFVLLLISLPQNVQNISIYTKLIYLWFMRVETSIYSKYIDV